MSWLFGGSGRELKSWESPLRHLGGAAVRLDHQRAYREDEPGAIGGIRTFTLLGTVAGTCGLLVVHHFFAIGIVILASAAAIVMLVRMAELVEGLAGGTQNIMQGFARRCVDLVAKKNAGTRSVLRYRVLWWVSYFLCSGKQLARCSAIKAIIRRLSDAWSVILVTLFSDQNRCQTEYQAGA